LSNDRGSWRVERTPATVTVKTSSRPLEVFCRADSGAHEGRLQSATRQPTTGTGAVAGAVVGGVAMGTAIGTSALMLVPPLGAIAVVTGAATGAIVGHTAQASQQPIHYPKLVSVPLTCNAEVASAKRPLGLGIRGLTLEEATAAGLRERTAVLVISVAADGRAALAGLQGGDVILALNGQELGDAADMEERLSALPVDVPLALRVWRDRRVVDLVLLRAAP
jgi:membrane-associated protease RseP (regulator of RpoE activity)